MKNEREKKKKHGRGWKYRDPFSPIGLLLTNFHQATRNVSAKSNIKIFEKEIKR
jgi:hypothetical protein